MTLDDAEAFAVAQGWPRFRGEQVWRWVHDHGVARLRRDDEPVAATLRAELAERATIGSARRSPRSRPRATARASSGWSPHDGAVDRERAHPRRRQDHAVHLVAGRLRGRLPVLRDREARARAQPRRRRDRRSGLPRARGCSPRSSPAAGSRTSSTWGWASRSTTTTTWCTSLRILTARQGRQAVAAPDHGVDRRASCPSSRSSAPRTCGRTSRCRSTRRTTRSATRSCRSTASGTSRKLLARAARVPARAAPPDHVRVRAARRRQRLAARRARSSRSCCAASSARSTSSRGTRTPRRRTQRPTRGGDRRVPERVQAARPADVPAHAARRRHRRRVRPAREPLATARRSCRCACARAGRSPIGPAARASSRRGSIASRMTSDRRHHARC